MSHLFQLEVLNVELVQVTYLRPTLNAQDDDCHHSLLGLCLKVHA